MAKFCAACARVHELHSRSGRQQAFGSALQDRNLADGVEQMSLCMQRAWRAECAPGALHDAHAPCQTSTPRPECHAIVALWETPLAYLHARCA